MLLWRGAILLVLLSAVIIFVVYSESSTNTNNSDSSTCETKQKGTENDEVVLTEIDIDGSSLKYDIETDNLIDETLAETSTLKRIEEQIDPKSEKVKEPTQNPREMQVTFINKSGKKVKLWWKGFDDNKVLQAEMENNSQRVINTFFGHEFFFTPFDNEDNRLHSVRMESHIDSVELLTAEQMAARDKEASEEKDTFLKEYYKKTGRRWKNYYPRPPVEHHMYDITERGQRFLPKTNATRFRACPKKLYELDDFNKLLNKLETEENEYKINVFEKLHLERLEMEEKSKEDRNWFHHVPAYDAFFDYFKISNDAWDVNYKVLRYNGTVLCQDLNELESIIEMEVLCTDPRVVKIPTFLSEEECDHIIEVGHYLGLRRSTVSESALKSADRTSSTVWLERKMSPIIDNIVRRVGDAVGIDENLLYLNASSESLQFVHYLEGELYRPHVDYGTDTPNNRFITFLMYLNNVENGGFTSFPNAHTSCKDENNYFGVKPMKGSAAWFYDLFPDGNVDSQSLHFAEPPLNGSEKYMTNLWIWDPFFK